jgi:hypothetical protein
VVRVGAAALGPRRGGPRPWPEIAWNRENHDKVRRRRENGKETGQTDMDLQNEWRAGVEDDETHLAAVTVFAEDAGVGRKTSPNLHRKSSPETRSKTSAMDLRGYERRLGKAIVLLESARRGLRRHIYRSRV